MYLLGTILFCSSLSAQKGNFCGTTETGAITKRLIENKKYLATHPIFERAITYVPIKFHIISTDAGTGGVKESAILDMLCGLNEFYAPMDIQFFAKGGYNYFNSTAAATDPQSPAGELQLKSKKVKQMINIFLCQSFTKAGLLGYYTEGYPGYQNDFLVIKKSEVSSGAKTAEHEIGHFFSLLHPFNGWEDNDYDPLVHGNPVNILTAPTMSSEPPFNSIAIEFVDGTNCQTAGDLICDTPASYNFANSYWSSKGCVPLDNSVKDYHMQIVAPDVKNIMDYFAACSDYHFSNKQQDLIKTDLTNRKATFGNNKLNCTTTPNLNIITTNVLSPNIDSGKVIPNYGDIKLDWEDSPGATAYIVEIDGATNFASPAYKSAIVTASEWTAPGLVKNKKYYWHVYPYNEYSTCAGWSKTYGFTTGQWVVSTNDIKELDSWKINPNPANRNSVATLELNSLLTFTADIIVSDITGKTVLVKNSIAIQDGAQTIEISTANLNAGMYLVQLRTETGIATQKLVIQ